MYRKTLLILFLFTISITTSFSQEQESVLTAPETWISEIIPFPMGFAPDIDFVGFEDLRFAPGWNKSGQDDFWAYSFVWYINTYGAMTETKLTETFNSYYDGLMGVETHNKADTTKLDQLDKSLCLFIKTDEGFSGKIRVWDRFFTKDYLILNIKVKEYFCSETNKQIVLCDISPKPFDHQVWGIFEEVQLKVECE